MLSALKKELRKTSSLNSFIIILFIIAAFTSSFCIGLAEESVLSSFNDAYSLETLLISVAQYIIIIPILLVIHNIIRKGKKDTKVLNHLKKASVSKGKIMKWIIISLSLTYIASYLSSFMLAIIEEISDSKINVISLVAEPTLLGYIANIVGMFLLAPFFEELLFRGMFFGEIKKYGSWFAILVTGITFGLWHANIGQTLYTMVLGICASFLIAKTDSIIPCIILHGIFNLIGTIQSLTLSGLDLNKLAEQSYIIDNVGKLFIIGVIGIIIIAIIIIGLIFFIIEVCKHKETFKFKDNCQLKKSQKIFAYFSSPVTIVLYLGMIALTIYNAI